MMLALTVEKSIPTAVGICHSSLDAGDFAAHWFDQRVCLFRVHYSMFGQKSSEKIGLLGDFRQLLRGSPESHMTASTRNVSLLTKMLLRMQLLRITCARYQYFVSRVKKI